MSYVIFKKIIKDSRACKTLKINNYIKSYLYNEWSLN